MGKKYMIRCDIEGVSGVVSYEQAEPGKPEFEFGKAMFMTDLLALLEGLNDGGAETITIYDEHFYGRNIEIDQLPDNVYSICGKPPYLKDWAGGLDKSFAGLILLGFHSKRGTENALLNHSYEPDIKNILLNGVSVGEIGMEAAIAGDYGVPLVLVTADSEGIAEAQKLIPNVQGIAVKESFSETGALCYSTALTSEWIYDAAKEIVEKPPKVLPYNAGTDVLLQVELVNGKFCDAFQKLFSEQMHGQTVVIRANSATEAWASYWDKKLKCFKEMEKNV